MLKLVAVLKIADAQILALRTQKPEIHLCSQATPILEVKLVHP